MSILTVFSQVRLLSLASIFNGRFARMTKGINGYFYAGEAHQLVICAGMIKPRLNETLDDILEISFVDYLFLILMKPKN